MNKQKNTIPTFYSFIGILLCGKINAGENYVHESSC